MPDVPTWHYFDGDSIETVIGKKALKDLVKDGIIDEDDQVCRAGNENWVDITDVIDIDIERSAPAPIVRPPSPRVVPHQAQATMKGADEIFCASCGAVIKAQAAICVHCGVECGQAGHGRRDFGGRGYAMPPKSRITFILLGLFLGGFGVHNFYAGHGGKGVTQLVMALVSAALPPLLILLGIWILVEICTVRIDGHGMEMV